MVYQPSSRRAFLKGIGTATGLGVVASSPLPEFITPAQASWDHHYWIEDDTLYEPVEGSDGSDDSGIGHCASVGHQGAYEHPHRSGHFVHDLTFGAQAATENYGDARNTITYQEFSYQANHSSIYDIRTGSQEDHGIYPRSADNWDYGPVAYEIGDFIAGEISKWVDRASSAHDIYQAAVEASPQDTGESNPGWEDSESYGYFNYANEIAQNTAFSVYIENDDWVTMDCDSFVDTGSDYYADTNAGFVVTMSKESASATEHYDAYVSTTTDSSINGSDDQIKAMQSELDSEFTLNERHPEEYPQEVVDKLGVEKIEAEQAGQRAKELGLGADSRSLWEETDEPIYFYHNPPVLILPKNSAPSPQYGRN